jgi:hypothetical protein
MASWTPDEDKILLELYEKAPREEILSSLPGRVWKSIYKRSVILGLYRPKEDGWTSEEDLILKNLYANAPQSELEEKLPGRSWKAITYRGCNVFRIRRSKEITQAKVRETNLARRGVEYPTQSVDVQKKIKQVIQEKFGVDNVFQAQEIKEKSKKTNLKNLGVENSQQNPNIKKKTEETCQEKYGVSNPFQLVDRVQAGMLKKHGVKSPLQNDEIKKKQQATNVEKYGVPVPAQNLKVIEKTINTNIDRFGTLAPSQNTHIKEKTYQTNFERYGVNNPAKLDQSKEKSRQTCLIRYGVEHTLQVPEIREKGYETSKINGSFEKSEEEENFERYLKMIDPSTEHHVKHPGLGHVIDFYMHKLNVWVQYDGTYWHGKTVRKNITARSKKIEKVKQRDLIENEKIINLVRFWSDEVSEAIKNNSIFDLIKNKFKEKNINANICHQYMKKLEWKNLDQKNLPFKWDTLTTKDFSFFSEKITPEIIKFIEKYEWLGTIGVPPKWCFTARYQGLLGGVILINEPTAYSKLLGETTSIYESLIQRGATASWTPKNLGSKLIMFACRWMVKNTEKRLFTAYGDPTANEIGTIYQACNFEYLGQDFGNTHLYQHPQIKNNKYFSPQILKRTSTFIRWCKNNNIEIEDNWLNEKGFKNLKNIPIEVKNSWTTWIKKIISESNKIKITKKHKYVLILGGNKKELKFLNSLKTYKSLSYPKRF